MSCVSMLTIYKDIGQVFFRLVIKTDKKLHDDIKIEYHRPSSHDGMSFFLILSFIDRENFRNHHI